MILKNTNRSENDNTLRILMVGNSFCYYYVEELYGLLAANPCPNRGYGPVEIFNLYYSGCSLSRHHEWWKASEAHYHLFKTDINGRVEVDPAPNWRWTLEDALGQRQWDYISLQGSSRGYRYGVDTVSSICDAIRPLAADLLGLFHRQHPSAQLLWHRTWPVEVGYICDEQDTVYTEDLLKKYDEGMQAVCDYLCSAFTKDKDYDLLMINSGAAWTIARAENAKLETSLIPLGGLCARLGISNAETFAVAKDGTPNVGDGFHDGDIGGGQLLNACVWYETLTGQSCLDNPYAPTLENGNYQLSEPLVALLKTAAHRVNNP